MARHSTGSRPVSIGVILKEVLKPGDQRALALRQQIRRVWEAAAPPAIMPRTRLVELRRQVLWVEVADSPTAQELQFHLHRILNALDQALGPGVVREIKCRLAADGGEK